MRKVKLIGPGLKLGNSWHWINDVVDITDEEYEKNKQHLKLLDTYVETPKANEDTSKQTNIEEVKNETTEETDEVDDEEAENETDEERELLVEKAKSLGITVRGNMKKETLLEKISEKENETEKV